MSISALNMVPSNVLLPLYFEDPKTRLKYLEHQTSLLFVDS